MSTPTKYHLGLALTLLAGASCSHSPPSPTTSNDTQHVVSDEATASTASDRAAADPNEAKASSGPETPTQAPPFTLPDDRGTLHASTDLFGKGPVVLVFYRGHW